MTAARVLSRLLIWDIRLQARENIYLFTVVTTLAFCTLLWLLPERAPDTIVTAILFLDPAVVGTSFVAAIVLMERSQNTLVALAVTPVRTGDYLLSKVVTLTVLTFVGGMALVCVAYFPVPLGQALRFIVAMVFTGAMSVAGGALLVATANSMNHFIARAAAIYAVLYLPFLAHFGVVDGVWAWILFAPNPGHAVLRALLWAADPAKVSVAETIYAFVTMALLTTAFFARANRLLRSDTVRDPA